MITYLLSISVWIYLGRFCAVYNNTQNQVLKEVISSFIFFIFLFFSCLLPGIFRIIALRNKNNIIMLLLAYLNSTIFYKCFKYV